MTSYKQRMNASYGSYKVSMTSMDEILSEMIEDVVVEGDYRKELAFLGSNLELITEVKYVRPHKMARYNYRMALKRYLNGETDKIDTEATFKHRVASLHIVYMTKVNNEIIDKTLVIRMPTMIELCSKNEISAFNAVLSHVEEITQVTIDEFTEGKFSFL